MLDQGHCVKDICEQLTTTRNNVYKEKSEYKKRRLIEADGILVNERAQSDAPSQGVSSMNKLNQAEVLSVMSLIDGIRTTFVRDLLSGKAQIPDKFPGFLIRPVCMGCDKSLQGILIDQSDEDGASISRFLDNHYRCRECTKEPSFTIRRFRSN